jgi:hypothetical protein
MTSVGKLCELVTAKTRARDDEQIDPSRGSRTSGCAEQRQTKHYNAPRPC